MQVAGHASVNSGVRRREDSCGEPTLADGGGQAKKAQFLL